MRNYNNDNYNNNNNNSSPATTNSPSGFRKWGHELLQVSEEDFSDVNASELDDSGIAEGGGGGGRRRRRSKRKMKQNK